MCLYAVFVCKHMHDRIGKCIHHGPAQTFLKVVFEVIPFQKPQSKMSVNKMECGHWVQVALLSEKEAIAQCQKITAAIKKHGPNTSKHNDPAEATNLDFVQI